MYRSILMILALCLTMAFEASAAEAPDPAQDAKELSGMSIVGNDEAPKSLYIIPWKSSELGAETSLNRMLDETDVPVDRDVFMRQLRFFESSTALASSSP
ncbi:MAG: hypothetical protein JRE16_03005 [Deltaproteobacteria bacterium]|nr:hypothetical protein [Deltaproteobacteria bacterium]MBW2503519.1 hypothetical protein [Deltaproteobacteria bacterium]